MYMMGIIIGKRDKSLKIKYWQYKLMHSYYPAKKAKQ